MYDRYTVRRSSVVLTVSFEAVLPFEINKKQQPRGLHYNSGKRAVFVVVCCCGVTCRWRLFLLSVTAAGKRAHEYYGERVTYCMFWVLCAACRDGCVVSYHSTFCLRTTHEKKKKKGQASVAVCGFLELCRLLKSDCCRVSPFGGRVPPCGRHLRLVLKIFLVYFCRYVYININRERELSRWPRVQRLLLFFDR